MIAVHFFKYMIAVHFFKYMIAVHFFKYMIAIDIFKGTLNVISSNLPVERVVCPIYNGTL